MRLAEKIKGMSKWQALSFAFVFWCVIAYDNCNIDLTNVKEPIFAIVYEIIINLDPIAVFKNGHNLDPDNFVDLFKKR